MVLNESVSSSPESCNVTVTCRTQSSSLNSTFTCTNPTCSEYGGDPADVMTSDVSLHLYLSNGLIAICNHSNKVSWSNDKKELKHLCVLAVGKIGENIYWTNANYKCITFVPVYDWTSMSRY